MASPQLNYKVALNDEARAAARRSFVRCDLCWPESKLDVEYQSRFAHEGEGARVRDSRRSNALASMGWKTIGVTGEELEHNIVRCRGEDGSFGARQKIPSYDRRLQAEEHGATLRTWLALLTQSASIARVAKRRLRGGFSVSIWQGAVQRGSSAPAFLRVFSGLRFEVLGFRCCDSVLFTIGIVSKCACAVA